MADSPSETMPPVAPGSRPTVEVNDDTAVAAGSVTIELNSSNGTSEHPVVKWHSHPSQDAEHQPSTRMVRSADFQNVDVTQSTMAVMGLNHRPSQATEGTSS